MYLLLIGRLINLWKTNDRNFSDELLKCKFTNSLAGLDQKRRILDLIEPNLIAWKTNPLKISFTDTQSFWSYEWPQFEWKKILEML